MLGDAAITVETDVADLGSVQALAKAAAERCGPVSVLIANAGHGGGGDALSNPDGWTRVLGTNLFGVLHCVQSFVPAMVASDRPGLVINTGSKQGITQPPGDTAYNVSKAGVKALTEGLAHTLREQTGDFGELVYASMDWVDEKLGRRSMQLMAEQVMPRVNAAIASGRPRAQPLAA